MREEAILHNCYKKISKGVDFLKKVFLLDTNVLMQSPASIYVFEDNDVIIAQTTLEELDGLKNSIGEKGYNARNAIREIYSLRQKGNLMDGIPLPGGGVFRMVENAKSGILEADFKNNDDVIMATAKKNNAILVTNDIGMTIKADIYGIRSEEFRNEQVSDDALKYTGRDVISVDDDSIDYLYQNKTVEFSNPDEQLTVNEFLTLKGKIDEQKTALAYFDGRNIKLIRSHETSVPRLFSPRNSGQRFMIKSLMAPVEDIPLVIIRGAAGTGKTMAALAAGLDGVEKGLYDRILLLRPNVKFDDDIGFLPGTEFEKIEPLLRPFKDNLEALLKNRGSAENKKNSTSTQELENKKEPTKEIEKLFEKGILRAESLAYIRGRSIANTFVIVDEAQNSTPLQAKSIITRIGMGSKIVLLGDPDQIDNPKLNKQTNGLVYAADKMRGSKLCMQLVLEDKECVRCPLALEAVKRL